MVFQHDKLTIQNIRTIYDDILRLFKEKNTIKLDFTNVDEIDISGVQLLFSLKQSCNKQNKKLILKNVKDEILYSLELAGVASILVEV